LGYPSCRTFPATASRACSSNTARAVRTPVFRGANPSQRY
jgi:hypothetical protein